MACFFACSHSTVTANIKTKVIIAVTNGSDMQARFMSKVMRNTGDFLLVIPFRHKGLRVNFDGKDVTLRDRILNFFPNVSFCNTNGCENKGINSTNMRVICVKD